MQRSSYRPHISPNKKDVNQELIEHSNRIKQLLRADLTILEEQNAVLKAKCKQMAQLQDKVESLLRQHNQALCQNDRISKSYNQLRNQYEILKNKLDSCYQHKKGQDMAHEFQIKKLLSEIEHLTNQLTEIEIGKSSQLSEMRNQQQLQLQNLKKNHNITIQRYQSDIRKFKQHLQKKDYELQDCLNQLRIIKADHQVETLKLRQDKEKLKNQLTFMENNKKNQIESLRFKLQMAFTQEIQLYKKDKLSTYDALEMENSQLKEKIQIKSRQFQEISNKLSKQKQYNDECIQILKKENDNLRVKLKQLEKINDQELNNLKKKFELASQQQIQQCKLNNAKFMDCLQMEIKKLEGHIKSKNLEIQQLVKEKTNARSMFDQQEVRYKEQLLQKERNLQAALNEKIKIVSDFTNKLNQKQKQLTYINQLTNEQQQRYQQEQSMLKKMIQKAKQQYQLLIKSSAQKQQALKIALADAHEMAEQLKQNLRKQRLDKQKMQQSLVSDLYNEISSLKLQVQTISSKYKIVLRQKQAVDQKITHKQKQNLALREKLKLSNQTQLSLEKENEELRTKIAKKDQKNNQLLADQKERLENSFAYTLENLKHDHEAAVNLQNHKYRDLSEKYKQKQNEIANIMKMFKQMSSEMEQLTLQQSNKKELTLKFPGATADLLATKNLFDVYLKTKVLDYCGDIQSKQNR